MTERENKLRNLVNWQSADARAVAQQLLQRVIEGEQRGLTVGVVTCFIHAGPDGRCYEAAFSTLPVEVSAWAAQAIERKIQEINNE